MRSRTQIKKKNSENIEVNGTHAIEVVLLIGGIAENDSQMRRRPPRERR
jgi:hypothetical protein